MDSKGQQDTDVIDIRIQERKKEIEELNNRLEELISKNVANSPPKEFLQPEIEPSHRQVESREIKNPLESPQEKPITKTKEVGKVCFKQAKVYSQVKSTFKESAQNVNELKDHKENKPISTLPINDPFETPLPVKSSQYPPLEPQSDKPVKFANATNFFIQPKGTTAKKPPVLNKNVKISHVGEAVKTRAQLEAECTSTNKTKSYDVEATREFMRKQQEKRAADYKSRMGRSEAAMDIKHQKLEDLNRRSRELVVKNVNMTRERSRSNDKLKPAQVIRPDRARKVLISRREPSQSPIRKSTISKPGSPPIRQQQPNPKGWTRSPTEKTTNRLEVPAQKSARTPKKPQRKVIFSKNVEQERVPLQNITVRSENVDGDPKSTVKEVEIGTTEKTPIETQNQPLKEKLTLHKTSSEPEARKKTAFWIHEVDAYQAYPCNFINAVKRKLQCAVNLPQTSRDVGVQNTLSEQLFTPERNGREKTKEEIKELLQKSAKTNKIGPPISEKHLDFPKQQLFTPEKNDRTKQPLQKSKDSSNVKSKSLNSEIKTDTHKSYVSHNINLDVQNVEHLALQKNNVNRIEVPKKQHFEEIKTDISESDTDKNIPEISSESIASLIIPSKNSSNYLLDINAVKDLKLERGKNQKEKTVAKKHLEVPKEQLGFKEPFVRSKIRQKSPVNPKEKVVKSPEKSSSRNSYSSDFVTDVSTSKSKKINITNRKIDTTLDDSLLSLDRTPLSGYDSIISWNKSAETKRDKLNDKLSSKSSTSIATDSTLKTSNTKSRRDSIIASNTSVSPQSSKKDVEKSKINSPSIVTNTNTTPTSYGEVNTFKSLPSTLGSSKEDSKVATNKSILQAQPLVEPRLSLKNTSSSNIGRQLITTMGEKNEIHLKFEAEVHLLNDFNESLKQFMEVERAFESLKTHNDHLHSKIVLQNQNTQTSIIDKKSSETITTITNQSIRDTSKINMTRGSDIDTELTSHNLTQELANMSHSEMLTGLEITNVDNTIDSIKEVATENSVTLDLGKNSNVAGLSLNMFDQLIKDEDVRIENLKTIIKIREQALLDRTKGELAWLEIQRKHLKETGKLQEASLVKKKQRGILLKHQHEKHEMQRLKQMQKAASKERKIVLNEQRNLIKTQLSTDVMLSKMKLNTPKHRKPLGPLKVLQQSYSESTIKSETSVSKSSCKDDKIIISHSRSIRNEISTEISSQSDISMNLERGVLQKAGMEQITNLKRTLLMREADLQKRRKAVEDLLQWNQKLHEEEKKIRELEAAASQIITDKNDEKTSSPTPNKYNFTGKQLNQLWKNMTGHDIPKCIPDKMYTMSQLSLERFCKSASDYVNRLKDATSNQISEKSDSVVSEIVPFHISTNSTISTESAESLSNNISSVIQNPSEPSKETLNVVSNEYTSDFESPSSEIDKQIELEPSQITSINELIDNFSVIHDEILSISVNNRRNELTTSLVEDVVQNQENESKENEILSKHDSTIEDLVPNTEVNESKGTEILDETLIETNKEEDKTQNDKLELSLERPDITKIEDVSKSPINVTLEDFKEVHSPAAEATTFEVNDTKIDEVSIPSAEISAQESPQNETKDEIDRNEQFPDVSLVLTDHEKIAGDFTKDKAGDKDKEDKLDQSSEIIEEFEKNEELASAVNENQKELEHSTVTSEENTSADLESIKSNQETVDQPIDTKAISELISKTLQIQTSQEDIKDLALEIDDSPKTVTNLPVGDNISTDLDLTKKSVLVDVPGVDATELLKKPTTIEQEITNLEQQQQATEAKDSLPYQENNSISTSISEELSKTCENISSDNSTSVVKNLLIDSIKSNLELANELCKDENKENQTPEKVDVKKRVSEILASTVDSPRNEKATRVQDLYTTTYEEDGASDLASPDKLVPANLFGNEAAELLRKQLAIEQEIKRLEEQQLKENLPFAFIREIPNKPPPPYTPPTTPQKSILPTSLDDVNEITNYSAKVLYNAYLSNNLDAVTFSESDFQCISKRSSTIDCCLFVFDICKELAKEHYKQFEKESGPSWNKVYKRKKLAIGKPHDYKALQMYINKSIKELLNFEKPVVAENSIIKWSRKKKDHVDEVLVLDSQNEETEWINYDKEEVFIKNRVANEILDVLLVESSELFSNIMAKKTYLF